jgi:hypothetical protein
VGEGAAVGSVGSRGGGCGEATLASIKLFFELERQQELVRRKISSLQRLMQCKLFVGQVCNDPRAHTPNFIRRCLYIHLRPFPLYPSKPTQVLHAVVSLVHAPHAHEDAVLGTSLALRNTAPSALH